MVVVGEEPGVVVVVVVGPVGRRAVVVVVVLGTTAVVAGDRLGGGSELGLPPTWPSANSVGPRPMAVSMALSTGTSSTPWSSATKPHGAPASRNPKTAAHRSAKVPRVPSNVMAAPTRVSPGARVGLTSADVNPGSVASRGKRLRK